MQHSKKDKYWLERFTEYKDSGLSRRAFCEAHGLNFTRFRYYWSKLTPKKKDSSSTSNQVTAPKFEKVILNREVATSSELKALTVGVTLANSLRLELHLSSMEHLPLLLNQLVQL